MRTLSKSSNRIVAGVCGGIAEYFGWNPLLVRLIWLLLALCAGTGIVAYIFAAIIIPER